MKKIIIILLVFAFAVPEINSCKKGNISGDHNTLVEGAYLTLLAQGNANIDYKNIDTSTVSITVGGKGLPIQSINLYVVLGQNLNPSSWKLIKAVPFSEGVVLTVTGSEIVMVCHTH
jgi:hypothetical protein